MGTRHDLSFCACTTACLASELPVSMGPRTLLWILSAKQHLLVVPDLTFGFVHAKHCEWHQNYKSLWVPALTCDLWTQISNFWTSTTCLYGSQTSPVILCMQNSVRSIRITSLYGSQTSPVVFGLQNSVFWISIKVSMCTRPDLSLCAFKTAWLAPEILDSMGPRPYLWLFQAKQQLLDQNNKSLWVPDIPCRFVLATQCD